ncbi:hypothetical protein U9R62_10915 [Cylindrospermopsis raciborskii DSH]
MQNKKINVQNREKLLKEQETQRADLGKTVKRAGNSTCRTGKTA